MSELTIRLSDENAFALAGGLDLAEFHLRAWKGRVDEADRAVIAEILARLARVQMLIELALENDLPTVDLTELAAEVAA